MCCKEPEVRNRVKIMKELQLLRQSNLFLGKHGAVTTRDIIKCGRRQPSAPDELANYAYMLLAEKLRLPEERKVVEAVIASACEVRMDTLSLYDSRAELNEIQKKLSSDVICAEGVNNIGITGQLRRTWRLLCACLDNSEPGLLIGETSTGKTTACQLYAASRGKP